MILISYNLFSFEIDPGRVLPYIPARVPIQLSFFNYVVIKKLFFLFIVYPKMVFPVSSEIGLTEVGKFQTIISNYWDP